LPHSENIDQNILITLSIPTNIMIKVNKSAIIALDIATISVGMIASVIATPGNASAHFRSNHHHQGHGHRYGHHGHHHHFRHDHHGHHHDGNGMGGGSACCG
jgi:hypothetical protein